MQTLNFQVEIHAPVHVVWTSMLDDEPYRQWTGTSFPGSYYEGSWELGDTIRFMGPSPDDDSVLGGLVATVIENRPDELVTVEYLGQVVDGRDDTVSEGAAMFAGTRESYRFSESGGVTTVDVQLDSDPGLAAMFADTWPDSLTALKRIAEAAAAGSRGGNAAPGVYTEAGFVLARDVDAPPAEVFRAWTDPGTLAWFFNPGQEIPGPPEVDLRVGGEWRQVMVINEDTRYVTGGIYQEIVPDTRLVFAWGAVGGWPAIDPDHLEDAPVATVIFDGDDGRTAMTFRLELPQDPPEELRGDGKLDGWTQTIDRLVAQYAGSGD
jgi:uncharacterized protein YndB with AHSA1/START domain